MPNNGTTTTDCLCVVWRDQDQDWCLHHDATVAAIPTREVIERLIERSSSDDPGFDVEVARRVDELA